MSETFLCSVSAVQVKIVPLLDAFQLLMMFEGMVTFEQNVFLNHIL
jgi:hypothetical protein